MPKKNYIFIFIFLSVFIRTNAQSKFRFLDANQRKIELPFRLINNLIVIPLDINGLQLSFILDTGVSKTILFDRNFKDSLVLKNIEKVNLRGLGDGKPVVGLLSKNNRFKIKSLISYNESIYIILRDNFNLSSRMGTTIHGIIGYNLLKDVIVKVNYLTKKITFYNPKFYRYRKCRRCQVLPLQFYRNKPYIDAQIQLDTIKNKKTPVKMLIDSGGSDALWLFEKSKKEILTPNRFFNDILGEGFSGTIYGNRSRIPEFSIGKFKLKKPTVSFLDTLSTFNARQFKERNGSIGGGILKRFTILIDYPNKKISFKKNSSFKKKFNYNMSGISIVYSGMILVKEENTNSNFMLSNFENQDSQNSNMITFVTSYRYVFKPSYKIEKIIKDSPAAKVGLKVNDVLIEINGIPTHKYKLSDIITLFQEKDKKRIRMTINRKGENLKFEFRLEKKI